MSPRESTFNITEIVKPLVLLRYFFGLRVSHPLPISKTCRDLPNTSMKDVIFLSFDTENIRPGELPLVKQFQAGISTLDTRDLQNLLSSRSPVTTQENNLLRTRNFCVGPSEYCSKATRRFLFGQSETVNPDEIKEKIESLTVDRDVVLVLHGGYNDLWLLKQLHINLQPDTQRAARSVLRLQQCSLKDLLTTLVCPFNLLHVAGNDANFTLRALLLIAVRDSHDGDSDESEQKLLSILTETALSTGPDNWHRKRDHVLDEQNAYRAELQEMRRRQKEAERYIKAVREAQLVAQWHWFATQCWLQAFWVAKQRRDGWERGFSPYAEPVLLTDVLEFEDLLITDSHEQNV